jgi:Asp-tRNA(Asn)/Glu-tRNA(Gln) amidotransferase A subunit family amidase
MGFKPSLGCIPTNGVIPFSETVDHVGLFAGSLEGLDDLMAVLNPDWQAAKPSPGMEDVTLAVPVGPYMEQTDPAGRTYFDQSLQRLKAAGIEIKEIPLLEDIDAINDRHQRLIAIELAQVHESWFENYGHLYRPKTVAFIEKGRRLAGEDVDSLKSSCLKLRQRLTDQMHSHNIAAWICPSTLGEAPAGLAGTGSPLMNLPWTHAGMPVISLPSGKGPQGLPLGIQLVGEFMQDPALVGTATQLVKALPK